VEGAVRAPQPDRALKTSLRPPLLPPAERERALDVAERVLAASLAVFANEGGAPESAGRYGGAVLVAEALARADRGTEAQVRAVLREALVFAPDRLSLAGGAAGLLVVLSALDPARTSLTAVRSKLQDALAVSLRDLPAAGVRDSQTFDLFAGAAGRALAFAHATDEPVAEFAPFAHALADAVERALASPDADTAAVNLGVSHGIAGILAALNFALPRDGELARRYVDLLLRCSHAVSGAHRWGAVWRPAERPSARRAWCYQTAGVAAVLADRARIDGDDALRALAANALAAVLDDPEPEEALWDAALCHGRSGVASIAWSFSGDERLQSHAERLARDVLDEFDASISVGYRTAAAYGRPPEERPGFIDAALGIAQFLIDAATAQERRWLPLFGLRPG
jgi:hypothetical protein